MAICQKGSVTFFVLYGSCTGFIFPVDTLVIRIIYFHSKRMSYRESI